MRYCNAIFLVFDKKINPSDIRLWRDEINNLVLEKKDPLFFNHYINGPLKGKPNPNYPLIQYRSFKGKGALYGINEGAQSIIDSLVLGLFKKWKGKINLLTINEPILKSKELIYQYKILNAHIFGDNAYEKYIAIKDPFQSFEFIEQKLIKQIYKLLKNDIGYLPDLMYKDISLKITTPLTSKVTQNKLNPKVRNGKGIQVWHTLDIEFMTNIHLPQYIAIGNNVAFGNGVITRSELLNSDHNVL